MFDFCVGKRSSALRAPVYKTVSLINQAFLVKLDECSFDRVVAAFIHRKSFSGPVAGVSELTALTRNSSAVFFLPCPCALEKFFSSEVFFLQTFFGSDFFNDLNFRCDTCMVGSRKPKCAVALHSLPSCEHILQSLVERMSHVKLSCDVRWRHNNCKRLFVLIYFCSECAVCFPHLIDSVFEIFRIIGFC